MNERDGMHPEGWMTADELEWLRGQACEAPGPVAEVGVWRGRSTAALLEGAQPYKRVYSVDNWADHSADPVLSRYYVRPERTFEEFMREFRSHIRDGRLHVLRMRSLFAAEWLRDEQALGMVFIDASHRYEDVYADILAWRGLMTSGSVLCGHDYGANGCPGVKRAVDELCPGATVGSGSIWSVTL